MPSRALKKWVKEEFFDTRFYIPLYKKGIKNPE